MQLAQPVSRYEIASRAQVSVASGATGPDAKLQGDQLGRSDDDRGPDTAGTDGAGAPARLAWPDVLTAMEERLSAVERYLQGIGEAPPVFVMPDGVGPVPEVERERATRVLARTKRVEAQIASSQDRVSGLIARAGRGPERDPAYFDARM
jgi:hypothetical protein